MPLELRSSRVLTQLLLSAHLLSLAILWLVHVTLLLKLTLFISILLSSLYAYRLIRALPRLSLLPNREIILHLGDEELTGEISHSTLVTPFLVLLRFQLNRKMRTVPIFYDALPSKQFRALRVQLNLNSDAPAHLWRR